MIKQSLTQICLCGKNVEFPEGEVKHACSCGATWELGLKGFWAIRGVSLTPIFTTEVKRKPSHYERYMQWRSRRKAGERC